MLRALAMLLLLLPKKALQCWPERDSHDDDAHHWKAASMGYVLAALVLSSCSAVRADSPISRRCGFILTLSQQINSARDESDRGSLAEALSEYVSINSDCGRYRDVVGELTGFLADKNDGVRWGAAESLAYIGPPARTAVPMLERALKESDARLMERQDVMLPTRYSGQAIRDALRSITGKNIPDFGDVEQ